jgi:hypothetical protein
MPPCEIQLPQFALGDDQRSPEIRVNARDNV